MRTLLLLILVALTGCDTATTRTGPSFTSYDSAGVQIARTAGARITDIGWVVDSIPSLVIGTEDAAGAPLYRVQGVRNLEGGGILIVNAGSRELQFYDSGGALLYRAGGAGEGPGEFRDPVLVPWPNAEDTLLVFDRILPRFQVFSMDGKYDRSVPTMYRWPAGRTPPVGVWNLETVLFERRQILGGEESLRMNGMRQLTYEYFWYNPATAAAIAIDSAIVDWSYRSSTGESPIPFSSRPTATVGLAGALITDGRTFEIREYTAEGVLHRILRVDWPDRPVTREAVANANLTGTQHRELPIPDLLPAFRSLQIDAQEWLWAELYDWDLAQPSRWIVFDLDGEARGTVQIPAGLEVESIGNEFVLGVRRDELGIETVHVHLLRRFDLEDAGASDTERRHPTWG